jgi:nucleoside phosphorylase
MEALPEGARVAVIAAMLQELRPIRARFSLRPEAHAGGRVYRGSSGSRPLVAAVTSMGTRAARRVTEELLAAFPVDHVIVVGIAGGIDPGLRIGDLVNPTEVFDETTGATVHPTPLGGAAPRGRLLTTDTLHNDHGVLERLRREGFVAVDMETAAIGAVAEARGLPWSVFRAISDFAGDALVDAALVGLARPDGSADPAAIARFVLRRPWRVPKLARLGRGMQRAVRSSSDAVFHALEAP